MQGFIRRTLAYAGFDVSGDAEALTEYEEKKYLPKVREFFQTVGTAIDLCVTHTNKLHMESDIWQFEEKELDALARIYLKRARRIGWMAQAARQMEHIADLGDGKDLAMIIGKRIVATPAFYISNGGFSPWLK